MLNMIELCPLVCPFVYNILCRTQGQHYQQILNILFDILDKGNVYLCLNEYFKYDEATKVNGERECCCSNVKSEMLNMLNVVTINTTNKY